MGKNQKNREMKVFSASTLCLLVAGHGHQHGASTTTSSIDSGREINPAIRAAIAKMDPFDMSLNEVFVLSKILRKGADRLTESRLATAFAEIVPTNIELRAFYELQQRLLKRAENMDEARLAIVGLEKSTAVDPSFFSEDARMKVMRGNEMVRAYIERDNENAAVKVTTDEDKVNLKSGQRLVDNEYEEDEERPVMKSKGLEFFLDVRNMGFDQQWKIAEWFKLHPTARLTKRRLGNIMAHSRQPSMRELNAFHIVQQNALKGKIENAWTQKMLDTLWKNLAADPIF